MSIKSKKWYENQINALENAAKNTDKFFIQPAFNDTKSQTLRDSKCNNQIRAELNEIYKKLHKLQDKYWLYYK